jgi:N-acetylmuramoyl-L-alanine amidase
MLSSLAGAVQTPAPGSPPASATLIRAIRHWSNGNVTKVAIDITGKPDKYKTGRLTDPDRMFIDIFGVEATPALLVKDMSVEDGLLRNLRVSRSDQGLVRIALDLAQRAQYTATLVPDPYRLEVELRGSGTAEPAPKEPVQRSLLTSAVEAVSATLGHPAESTPAASADSADNGKVSDPVAARDAARTLIRTLGLKIGRVVIDPGHGGDDHGVMTASGVREKDIVLDIGIRLGRLLQSLGAEVVYTRAGDYFVPLEARTTMANREQADLFISIHANSSPDASIRGIETYYLNFTSSPEALALAQRENAVNQRSLGELRGVVQKIAQQEKLYESREFATTVQQSLARALPDERNRGVKEAPFVVLTGATMPAILSEISFMTNGQEERRLVDPAYRQKVAEALYAGVSEYIASLGGVRQPRPGKPAGALADSTLLPLSNRAVDELLDFVAIHRTLLATGCALAAVWSFLLIAPPSSRRKRRAAAANSASSAEIPAKLRIVRRSNGRPLP